MIPPEVEAIERPDADDAIQSRFACLPPCLGSALIARLPVPHWKPTNDASEPQTPINAKFITQE
jgi:hypothetical protein